MRAMNGQYMALAMELTYVSSSSVPSTHNDYLSGTFDYLGAVTDTPEFHHEVSSMIA
jgi:hypothetical protein